MKTLEVYDWDMKDAVRIPSRKKKWCAKCACFHEHGFFWRRKGMMKTCGFQFSKSALGVKTAAT